MTAIVFSKDEKERMVQKLKSYFSNELDSEIGSFDAEFLIDFFAGEMGPFYYNRGLSDAQLLFTEKIEEMSYLIQEMEKPTD